MDIQYSVKRSRKRKKTICLQICSASEVTVYAPAWTPDEEIRRFIEEKQDWISRSIRKQAANPVLKKEKQYITGEVLYYLGQAYPLEAFFEPLENQGLTFWNDRFFLNCPAKREVQQHYVALWYKKKAQEHIPARVIYFSQKLGFEPVGIRITSARSRWGSCSSENALAFSFRLMMAPIEAIDYVVIHELMHIRQKNHSSKFWHLVLEAMPQYKMHRRWLRDHQPMFEL
ncbi:MAG: SprT family zinc-dependent metalloprotease [Smithellaceae bacterium]